MSELAILRLSEEEWLKLPAQWNEVLGASTGDPVFGSWEWQTGWWRHFGAPAGWELWLLAFERQGEIVGFFPAYVAPIRRRGLRLKSAQMLGHHFRDSNVLISEYLDVIARPDCASQVARSGLEFLIKNTRCDEFVLCATRSTGILRGALRERGSVRNAYIRDLDSADAFCADLSAGFGRYLESLGQSTRRSVYLMRKRLQGFGSIRLDHAGAEELDEAFDDLNRLHATRWGEAVFRGKRLAFHKEFARAMARGGRLILSRLWVGDRVVSVLYDVLGNHTQYNMQMGFEQNFGSGISLGLLHIGYALEDAAAKGVTRYDFLAGAGQRTQYKAHLAQQHQTVGSNQLLVNRWLAKLYRFYDRVK